MNIQIDKVGMEQIFSQMVDLLHEDALLRERTKDVSLVVGCEVTDLDLTVILSFHRGELSGQVDGSLEECDVRLALTSSAFDRIFSGQLGVMQAVLAGELSFSGKIPSAMELEPLLPEMMRIYQVAKENLGGGDILAASPTEEAYLIKPIRPNDQSIRPKILITAQMDQSDLDTLARYGQVIYESFADKVRLLAGKNLVDALRDIDVFVTEVEQLRAPLITQLDRLKVIVTCHSNPVNIDVEACTAHGIPVICTPGRDADAVAELATCFILMLARRVAAAMPFLKGGARGPASLAQSFFQFQGNELTGKTVGLVGLGRVARGVATRLRGFGPRLISFDPYVDPNVAASLDVTLVPLAQLLRDSDFITLHAPVTPETSGLIGRDQIALMKRTAYFVNTARAALTDELALAEALREKQIAGAAFDVFSQEPPPPDHPFLHLENVIATPHIGGNAAEVIAHQSQMVVDDLVALFEGRKPRFVVNSQALEHLHWKMVARRDHV